MRTILLATHESQAELNIELRGGDTIVGKVTNAAGDIIPKATVKAVKRFESDESEALDRYTTEHLPQQSVTTNETGEFYFESLFEGYYVFEVSADGYETATTVPLPAGYSNLRVILKPTTESDQASVPTTRAILGTVIHRGTPKAIDLTLNGVGTPEQESELSDEERILIQSGKVQFHGIYEVNGNELKICWGDWTGETDPKRPEQFSAGEKSDRTLLVFERSMISE